LLPRSGDAAVIYSRITLNFREAFRRFKTLFLSLMRCNNALSIANGTALE